MGVTIRSAVKQWRARRWDRRLGIDTVSLAGMITSESPNCDAVEYESVDYYLLNTLLAKMHLQSHDVFLDVGCGMGRAVCLAAQWSLRLCIGIEVDRRLAALAAQNAARLKECRTHIEIICGDAGRMMNSYVTAIWLYNPFGMATMHSMLQHLRASWISNPRDIRIMYLNPRHGSALAGTGWLRQTAVIRVRPFRTVAEMWESTPQ